MPVKKAAKKASPRKTAARKATKGKMTPAARAKLAANAAKGRAAKAAKDEARRASGDYGDLSPMQVAHGISEYLETLRMEDGSHRMSPETARKRLAKLEAEARQTTTPIKLLKIQNKMIQLRGATENGDAHAFFVRYGAAYAAREGIVYAAFRGVGVPAAVLKEAGISP